MTEETLAEIEHRKTTTAQNLEAIGCATSVLQRTDSRTMPEEVRALLVEARQKLSIAFSKLKDGSVYTATRDIEGTITASSEVTLKADGFRTHIGAIADALPTADDATQSAVGRAMTKAHEARKGRKLVKAGPALGAQLSDLRTIIDKVEAARVRVHQRSTKIAVDEDVEMVVEDILGLLLDARQTAVDMRDDVERTLSGRFWCLRDLKVGDCFRFKNPPPGWSSGKLQLVEGNPGFAMPEGWDFIPIELLDSPIEVILKADLAADRAEDEASIKRRADRVKGSIKCVGKYIDFQGAHRYCYVSEGCRLDDCPASCATCRGTGVIETGNNDLPCSCEAGDRAIFSTTGGQRAGKQLKVEHNL